VTSSVSSLLLFPILCSVVFVVLQPPQQEAGNGNEAALTFFSSLIIGLLTVFIHHAVESIRDLPTTFAKATCPLFLHRKKNANPTSDSTVHTLHLFTTIS
jgi:hypothetical protein